jgi:DUF1009 family protein
MTSSDLTLGDTALTDASSPLGIIAGGGHLPAQLIDACRLNGRDVVVVAIEGETESATVENVPHVWIRLGAIGVAIDHLSRYGAKDLVLAGKINRPSIKNLRPDAMGAKLISKLGFSLFGGDASIFKTIIAFLEDHGFRVIGIDDILQDLTAPEGPLGQNIPDKQAQKDIEMGARIVRAIGQYDIGQGVIVKNGLVLGIEAAEGTDALIERCGALQVEGRGGVLIKARKPIQEDRADLPTIGLRTIELVHQAGFAGIAIEAKYSLVVGRREVIRMADTLGLFVIGFTHQE